MTTDRRTGYAWLVVLLLMATQIVSYIDRFLPSLLIEPIKQSLDLSQTQIGLLFGPAFAIFYVSMGLPIGWLADHAPRRLVLAAGVTIWCCMTMAGSLAESYLPLFATRLGVGLGEAAVAPCALAIISDYFQGARRARAVSLYMCGTFLGAGSAFFFGGLLVHAISDLPPVMLPLLGAMPSWRLSFLIVGAPGLLLAVLLLFVREAPRGEPSNDLGGANFPDVLRFLRRNWRAYGALFIGSGCSVTFGGLAFWNATIFSQAWGWDVGRMGTATGLLLFSGGLTGTLLGLWITTRAMASGRKDATLLVLLGGLSVAIPAFASYSLMPTAPMALTVLGIGFVTQGVTGAAGTASLTFIAPSSIRSQATAVFFFTINIIGHMFGPPIVGFLADHLGGPRALLHAVAIASFLIGVPALAALGFGLKHYRRLATELAEVTEPERERRELAREPQGGTRAAI